MRGFELKGCIPNYNKKNKKQSTQKKSTGLFSNFKDGEVVPGIGIVRKIIKN